MRKLESILFLNTKTIHYINQKFKSSTMCALEIDDENWTLDTCTGERLCKRCRVASGVPARRVYKYGPMAWKRTRRYC